MNREGIDGLDKKIKLFLKKKNIEISAKRYFIDALGAMAQGLFASLLIGTIIGTLGAQLGIEVLVTIGNYAKSSVGAAMAIAIDYGNPCFRHCWNSVYSTN